MSVCMLRKSTSSILLSQKRNTYEFQKHDQSILEVHFVTKLLLYSKYIYLKHANPTYFSVILIEFSYKLWKSKYH